MLYTAWSVDVKICEWTRNCYQINYGHKLKCSVLVWMKEVHCQEKDLWAQSSSISWDADKPSVTINTTHMLQCQPFGWGYFNFLFLIPDLENKSILTTLPTKTQNKKDNVIFCLSAYGFLIFTITSS